MTDDTIDNASDIFRIDIGTYKWNSTLNVFEYDSTGTPNLIHGSGQFKMRKGSYDNAGSTGQFTLIDVQYLDPGDPSHTKVAYHLYIPVIVEKVMHYDFRAIFLTGTSYLLNPYKIEWDDTAAGNTLVENTGNPATLEIRYTYEKTIDEWRTLVDSGESFLYTYDKRLSVRAQPNVIPSGTRMTLVDPNCGSRLFYGQSNTAYSSVTGKLNLNNFTAGSDGTGDTFKSVLFNDFFTVTSILRSGDGKYDKVTLSGVDNPTVDAYIAEGAVIRDINGDYYKYNEAGTGNYDINIEYKTGVSDENGFIKEDYYITFFTPKTEVSDTNLYHLELSDPGSFGNSTYPSLVKINYASHLLTGNIFTNDFSIEENNSIQRMSLTMDENYNDTIGATLTAEIGVDENIRNTIQTYLGFNKVKVYQSFLLSLNMQNSLTDQLRGIQVRPKVSFAPTTGYKINNGSDISSSVSVIMNNSNFIELRSNEDLSSLLVASCTTGNPVVINTEVNLRYDNNEDLEAQFPLRDTSEQADIHSVVGTRILGSSNLASSPESAAFSAASHEEYASHGYLYYRTTSSNAVLTLNSDDANNENGEFYQLGINVNELDDATLVSGYVPIRLRAFYDISDVARASEADSMKITISVYRKDNYNVNTGMLPVGEYIRDLIVGDASVTTDSPVNATSYVYEVNDPYDTFTYSEGIFNIPVCFSAYTGPGSTFEEDSNPDNKLYANYMIRMQVELYEDSDCVGLIDGTIDDDHVIWTNSKIIPYIIK